MQLTTRNMSAACTETIASDERRTAFEEAFAHLSDEFDVRFDAAQHASPCGSDHSEIERFVGRIRDQLKTIEQHRDHLVGLLRGLETGD